MYVIIVGCGSVGAALANTLAGEGHDVVVVDRNSDAFERLGSGFNGMTVVGTGIDEDVLRKAGIEHADALAAVTSNDSTNIMVAQIAQELFHVPRVVARVFDPDKEFAYHELGLDTVSPTVIGVAQIRNAILANGWVRKLTVGPEIEVVQITVGSYLSGKRAGEVNDGDQLRLIAVTRGRRSFIPLDETALEEGDVVLAAVKVDCVELAKYRLGVDREWGEER